MQYKKVLNSSVPPAEGKCELGIGFSAPQLASCICQMNYPSSQADAIPALVWGPSSGDRDSPDSAFTYLRAHLGAETDAKAETDVSSVDCIYSQQVWFPQGACSFLQNDSPVLQLRGITEFMSSSKHTQSQKLNEVSPIIVTTVSVFSCKHKMLCHSFSDPPTSLSFFAVGSSL